MNQYLDYVSYLLTEVLFNLCKDFLGKAKISCCIQAAVVEVKYIAKLHLG